MTDILSSHSGGWELKINSVSGEDSLPDCRWLYSHEAERKTDWFLPLLIRTLIPSWAPPLKWSEEMEFLSHVRLRHATPWTIAHQAPLSMGFSGQEYWSGLPFLSPEDNPDTGIEPRSPCVTGRFFTVWVKGKSKNMFMILKVTVTIVDKVGITEKNFWKC